MRRQIAAVIALALAGVSLHATLTLPADFRTVVNDASLIMRGRVTDVRSITVPGVGVESVATFAVENVVKGQASGFVYVRVPGGIIGSRRYVTVGAPAFRVGQRAMLFLRPGATDTAFRPIGMTMGVYPINVDPATGRTLVEPPLLAGMTADAKGAVVRGDKRRTSVTIVEFESLVRLAMSSPPGAVTNRGKGGK
jgi:hypothetical protein